MHMSKYSDQPSHRKNLRSAGYHCLRRTAGASQQKIHFVMAHFPSQQRQCPILSGLMANKTDALSTSVQVTIQCINSHQKWVGSNPNLQGHAVSMAKGITNAVATLPDGTAKTGARKIENASAWQGDRTPLVGPLIPIARGRRHKSAWPPSTIGQEHTLQEQSNSTEPEIEIRAPPCTSPKAQLAQHLSTPSQAVRDAEEVHIGQKPALQIIFQLGQAASVMRVASDTTTDCLCHRIATAALLNIGRGGVSPSRVRLAWRGRILPGEATLADATLAETRAGVVFSGVLWIVLDSGGCGASRSQAAEKPLEVHCEAGSAAASPLPTCKYILN
jgi:hypothetical protein